LFGETEVAATPTINPDEIKYYVKQMKDEEDGRRVRSLLELQNTINEEIDVLGGKIDELEQEKANHQVELADLEKGYEELESILEGKKGS
jgi:chromosome segregation ATPase